MSEFLGRGGCGRRPLIIFNTAVPQRLKTKSQLRKELWGWSKAPRAVMQDERTLDSDCICDLSPLNLHPASVSPAKMSSSHSSSTIFAFSSVELFTFNSTTEVLSALTENAWYWQIPPMYENREPQLDDSPTTNWKKDSTNTSKL